MAELQKFKRENHALQEERMQLKVAADKYESRAIYVRKKYHQLLEKTSLDSQ